MSSTKRIILANHSRLLREMLEQVLNKTNRLRVVGQVSNYMELPSTIERFDPEWVITSFPVQNWVNHWIDTCIEDHPSVRFLFLSPNQNHIKIRRQASNEENHSDLSLNELIHLLEKDLQRT